MAGFMRGVFFAGRYRRLAAVATAGFCILCYIPHAGFCEMDQGPDGCVLAKEILNLADSGNIDSIKSGFDQLETAVDSAEDPLAEGRKFLHSFIEELNARYGLALTIQDACKIVRENIHTLQIPLETQNLLLITIELLESNLNSGSEDPDQIGVSGAFYWPNEWNWFGLNKKKKEHHKVVTKALHSRPNSGEVELPGNCYVGACELLAGALIAIIPVPGALWLGGAIIGDGARRIIDGVVQLSDERRSDPNFISPQPPF